MDELLNRGVEEIISREEFTKALRAKKPLRLKFGVDPSRPDIHVGHAVVLRTLRRLQDMGHVVIFLIGDTTARIGDPSGKNKTRPVLSEKEITHNAQTYLDQVGKILDVKKAEIRRNSEWFDKLDFSEILKLAGNFSVSQLIEREDFKNRLASGNELGMHELLYPVMQAYDSVMLEADVEFGGTDQRFNMLAGRALQKKLGQQPQQVFMAKLLVGTDGSHKMSKSLDNYIGITDKPSDMFGKVMSIPDELIGPYYELCTTVDLKLIDEVIKTIAAGANPRDVKASLARQIVAEYYDEETAVAAEKAFDKQFRDKERPDDIPTFEIKVSEVIKVSDVLPQLGLASSKSETRRLMEQGGVRIDDEVITEDELADLKDGAIVQVGKRRFARIKRK
jgi:tyrosyl-tRNA synthetase